MWRPDAVVSGHKHRGIVLWIFMIFGILAYASWLLGSAVAKQKDPDTSLLLSNAVYDYPDIWVCLSENTGCDNTDLEKDCATSSIFMEGLAPTAVFYPNASLPRDERRQDIPGVPTYTELGWCVVFNTSSVTTFRGEERDSEIELDYFLLDMYWYPGGSANNSTTCVPDGEEWDSHREWAYVYFHDQLKNTTSPGMQISYSCVTSGSSSHVFTTMGIGLTEEINLKGPDCRSYKALSMSSSTYKVKVTMKRQISQKLVVKYNGRTLLNKRYMFARPAHGYCFVEWAGDGATLSICYQKPSRGILTNADNYELRVEGRTFVDLPDGCNLTPTQQQQRQAPKQQRQAPKQQRQAPKQQRQAAGTAISNRRGVFKERSSSSRRFVQTDCAQGATAANAHNNDTTAGNQQRRVNGASLARARSTDFF